ncbi:hypothetical protein Tco_1081179 [Tanacetum coccineum]|uniref:Uncharacterized protein n=1 Tax=Tanacetum coccineum TaxID=301880 RepID=A0ABQ5HWZ7_9ASTR
MPASGLPLRLAISNRFANRFPDSLNWFPFFPGLAFKTLSLGSLIRAQFLLAPEVGFNPVDIGNGVVMDPVSTFGWWNNLEPRVVHSWSKALFVVSTEVEGPLLVVTESTWAFSLVFFSSSESIKLSECNGV